MGRAVGDVGFSSRPAGASRHRFPAWFGVVHPGLNRGCVESETKGAPRRVGGRMCHSHKGLDLPEKLFRDHHGAARSTLHLRLKRGMRKSEHDRTETHATAHARNDGRGTRRGRDRGWLLQRGRRFEQCRVRRGRPGFAQIKPADRTAAPRLSGTTIAGRPYSTSYQGHITVINVWGSWCTACREEAPSFSEAAKKYASKDVQFLGIDTIDNDASAQTYDSQFGITYPSLADPDQLLVLDLKALLPSEPPSTLIVDRSGKVAVRAIGGITEPELDQDLAYVQSGSE